MLIQKLRNLLGGRGRGHQRTTSDYRGEGGGLGSPEKDYIIFQWSLTVTVDLEVAHTSFQAGRRPARKLV